MIILHPLRFNILGKYISLVLMDLERYWSVETD